MKKITFLWVMLFISSMVIAQPMSGVYKVGVSESAPNFTSLKAATDALNVNGMNGDVVFEITSDLLETESSRIGVNTGTYSLTIRPDADVDRKIELNKAADNSKASGLIIIGMSADSWENLTTNTHNVTIDGYAPGENNRRLILATTDEANIYHGPVQIVGVSKNITVKNCILNQRNASSGSTTYAVRIRIEKNAAGTAFEPSDITIENNVITAVKNTAQMGVGLTCATGLGAYKLKNVVIKNNEITARTRGISMTNNENIVIEGNTFRTEQTSGGMLSTWIQGINYAAGTVTVKGNKFISALTANTTAGSYGIRGIIASGGGTWYIENNFFTGFQVTGATGSADMIAIRCGNTCYIRNNTFFMNSLGAAAGITPVYQGILVAAGAPEIRNNILISNEDAKVNTLVTGTTGSTSDYNIMYLRAGNTNARINSTYATLADYQAANPSKDIFSKSVDVTFADEANGNLHLAGASFDDLNLAAPVIPTVTTDIDGNLRTTLTYKGANQATDLTAIAKQFTVTVPNGTENVYVAGSFTGKAWDITDPFQLIGTTNPNEFSEILPCVDGVEYKYLCEKGDWDYQEAVFDDGNPPLQGSNRTYNASDVVPIWYRVNKITLNAIPTPEVANLWVKGSWDNWMFGLEMTYVGPPLPVKNADEMGKVKSETNSSFFTITLGGRPGDKFPADTKYKYFTTVNDPENWEVDADGFPISDRWAIAPVMYDFIPRFGITTDVATPTVSPRILRTYEGVQIELGNEATVEIYTTSGMLIDKVRTSGTYTKDLNSGVYIICIDGQATKFMK